MARRPLVAGNWKMNGLMASAGELEAIIVGARGLPNADFIICPPATLVARFAALAQGSRVAIGGQDCHAEPAGAYTGDIAAEMLKDAGAVAVIVGHSERRRYYGETDAMVRAKALAARRAGLLAIVCVGETGAERDAGKPMIAVGDLNIAPLEQDVWSHKQLLTVVSHTPVEVERLGQATQHLAADELAQHAGRAIAPDDRTDQPQERAARGRIPRLEEKAREPLAEAVEAGAK